MLKRVPQRVLLLVSDGDWLIPSAEEGPRLKQLLPRCRLRVCIHFSIVSQKTCGSLHIATKQRSHAQLLKIGLAEINPGILAG